MIYRGKKLDQNSTPSLEPCSKKQNAFLTRLRGEIFKVCFNNIYRVSHIQKLIYLQRYCRFIKFIIFKTRSVLGTIERHVNVQCLISLSMVNVIWVRKFQIITWEASNSSFCGTFQGLKDPWKRLYFGPRNFSIKKLPIRFLNLNLKCTLSSPLRNLLTPFHLLMDFP